LDSVLNWAGEAIEDDRGQDTQAWELSRQLSAHLGPPATLF
jgi:hypothetical protein